MAKQDERFIKVLNVLRRENVLELHAVDLDAPGVGRLVEDGAHLGVDDVAGGKGLVELEIADDVAERCGRERLHGHQGGDGDAAADTRGDGGDIVLLRREHLGQDGQAFLELRGARRVHHVVDVAVDLYLGHAVHAVHAGFFRYERDRRRGTQHFKLHGR